MQKENKILEGIEISPEVARIFLKRKRLNYEKVKFRLSPFAGRDKPFLVRAFNNTKKATVYFFKETYNATKIILREII